MIGIMQSLPVDGTYGVERQRTIVGCSHLSQALPSPHVLTHTGAHTAYSLDDMHVGSHIAGTFYLLDFLISSCSLR